MGYRNLRECVADLERAGQLVRIEQEVDPHLEAAEFHRETRRAAVPTHSPRPLSVRQFPGKLPGSLLPWRYNYAVAVSLRTEDHAQCRLPPSRCSPRAASAATTPPR